MSVRLRRVAARGAKRLLSILLMVAFLFGSTGVPVVTRVAKDRSQPFPCQDNPCGCSSADECWHHCCCNTNRQKVAWASEHGVTPPDFVIAAAEQEQASAEHVCCQHHGCEKCVARLAAKHAPAEALAQSGKAQSGKSVFRARLVLLDLARHCRSLSQYLGLFDLGLPVRIETAWSFDRRIVGRVMDAPVLPRRVELCPPVPPPKLGPLAG